ncbi:MAG: PAS domain S-box protein, partial [Bacteroidota bacterium]
MIPGFSEPPNLIIDKAGRIIASNSEFKKLIPSKTAQQNFFELFDEEKLLTLQRIFLDARKFESTAKDTIRIENESGAVEYDVAFSPMRSENNIYFLITFNISSKSKGGTETQKFWIAIAELEKIVRDKKIVSVINRIKLTYPFTFIEKAKVQKEINELDEYFWIKDIDGKYAIVNEKYAESLGFKASQLENKNEGDFLPKYLTNLYKTVDSYIIESTNAVILDSIAAPITAGAERNLSIIEFPLCDLDNHVVAIIGFSQKSESKIVDTKKEFSSLVFKDLLSAVMLIDEELKVAACSNEFVRLINPGSKVDLTGKEITKIFEKGFIPFLENYIKDTNNIGEYVFNYVFMEKTQLNSEVHLKKIFDENNKYFATQIFLKEIVEDNSQIEVKAKMYDALIHHTPEAMFVYDIENLKFLEVNEEALKLYGYKRSDFLNMDLTDLYAPEDIQTLIESGESKIVPGSYSGPWRHKKSDGSSVLVEVNRTPIEFKEKKAHLNIVRNVSGQADLKKKLQILESAFENTSDPIINTDKEGFITETNEPVSKKLGYS